MIRNKFSFLLSKWMFPVVTIIILMAILVGPSLFIGNQYGDNDTNEKNLSNNGTLEATTFLKAEQIDINRRLAAVEFMSNKLQGDVKLAVAGQLASTASNKAHGDCYYDAMAAFWYAGVAAARGEDDDFIFGAVAEEIAFDSELAALWEASRSDQEAFFLFARLLQAKAWHGKCLTQ